MPALFRTISLFVTFDNFINTPKKDEGWNKRRSKQRRCKVKEIPKRRAQQAKERG